MVTLNAYPEFRAALVGWNSTMRSREAQGVTTAPPEVRASVLRKLSNAFDAAVTAAVRWQKQAEQEDSTYGIEDQNRDALRTMGRTLEAMVSDLSSLYGVQPVFREDEPPCWSPRYESYIHGAMPMYSVQEMLAANQSMVQLPPYKASEAEITEKLSTRPALGYDFSDDEIEDFLAGVQRSGQGAIASRNNRGGMVLTKELPRAATDLEMLGGLVYLTARGIAESARNGSRQGKPTLVSTLSGFLTPDPALSEQIREERDAIKLETEKEREAIERAFTASRARREAGIAALGLPQKPRRLSAADRRKIAARTK